MAQQPSSDGSDNGATPRKKGDIASIEEVIAFQTASAGDLLHLFGAGLSPNLKAPNDVSLLHLLAERGEPAIFEAALRQGADPKAQDAEGNSVLHYAASPDIALLLLMQGASARAMNHDSQTPEQTLTLNDSQPAERKNQTRALLKAAVTIEAGVKAHASSVEIAGSLWPERAYQYGGGNHNIAPPEALRLLLKQAKEREDPIPKETLASLIGLSEAVISSPTNIHAWREHCDQQGTARAMTARDWQDTGILEARMPDAQEKAALNELFNPNYWRDQPSLQPMVDLFKALPPSQQAVVDFGTPQSQQQIGLSFQMRENISRAFREWPQRGGKDKPRDILLDLHKDMPPAMQRLFSSQPQSGRNR